MVPALEKVRYTCSGTEATMHLVRLAREITGKDKIIKFEGHFHGYHDYVQFSSSPPLQEAGPPDSPTPYCQSGGIPGIIADLIIVVPFNDVDAVERAIEENKKMMWRRSSLNPSTTTRAASSPPGNTWRPFAG